MKKEAKTQDEVREEYYENEDSGGSYEPTSSGGVQPYSTSDLGCAAAIHCRGFSLLELDRKDSQRVGFVFQRTRDVMSVVAAYWDNNLPVDAQSYFASIRTLKNRLHAE